MSNPALTTNTFRSVGRAAGASDVMTLGGTIIKTAILLAILFAAGYAGWSMTGPITEGETISGLTVGLLILSLIGGMVLALVTIFVPRLAPITSPLYAVAEGFLLGVISSLTEKMFNGIVLQAVLLTSGVLFAMLFLYLTRIIQPTRYFVMGVVAATCGIAFFYLIVMLLSMFHVGSSVVEMVYGNSLLSIGISVFVVAIAALNLIIDFGQIEQGVSMGAPKYMEWYGGFALLVTLVWLYLEILRLLSKIRSRN
jgi:uncharacterized YccA/Bax inhibitor family protein